MDPIKSGFLFRGGDYSVEITVKNRSNGRVLLERELLSTEVLITSQGTHVFLDLKTE